MRGGHNCEVRALAVAPDGSWLADNLDDTRREELHGKWVEFFEGEYGDGKGGVAHGREYLLVVGTRR